MIDDNNKKDQNEMQISINLDTTPILYTDNVFMNVNENGVVLDITQNLGPTNQLRVVSRIGMSREHAKRFLKEFGKLLAMTEGQGQTGEKKNS
ncbi:MAG: DUF3467 domain-containing protein [Candidatus Roizmanbacteria bacterium]